MKSRTSLSKRQRRNAFKIGFLYFQDTNVIIKLDDDGNIIENKKQVFLQENSSTNNNSQEESKTSIPSDISSSSTHEQTSSTPLTNSNATYDDELSFQEDINLLCNDIEFEMINDFENINLEYDPF